MPSYREGGGGAREGERERPVQALKPPYPGHNRSLLTSHHMRIVVDRFLGCRSRYDACATFRSSCGIASRGRLWRGQQGIRLYNLGTRGRTLNASCLRTQIPCRREAAAVGAGRARGTRTDPVKPSGSEWVPPPSTQVENWSHADTALTRRSSLGWLASRSPCRWSSPSGDTERPSEAVDPQQLCVPRRCTGAGWCV